MKSFREFLVEGKKKEPKNLLSWKSSFSEMRDKVQSQDKKQVKDEKGSKKELKESDESEKDKPLEHTGHSKTNEYRTEYDSIHDHPDVKPKHFTKEHTDAVKSYTGAGMQKVPSSVMNDHLRHHAEGKSGEPDSVRR